MKLTNEEKRKTFGQHIGCEAIFNKEGFLQVKGELLGVDAYGNSFISTGRAIPPYKICDIDFSFLLLTPISSITDEHAIEFYSLNAAYPTNDLDDIIKIETVKEWLIANESPICWDAYQYLISKGYAVPLWFGVGHWANGKTAIELGIAIEKPQL